MNSQILITPADLLALFLGACGAVTATAAAGAVIVNLINKLKSPNRVQNERLDKHEQWLTKIDVLLEKDNRRLKALEDGNRITMKALLALLRHGIDGNDTAGMKKVETELQEYLTDNR